MTGNERVGRKIARRACDLCRSRRIQCQFPDESSQSCQRCTQAGAPCTFLTDRKRRGPRSRHVDEARRRAEVEPVSPQPDLLPMPIGAVTLAHLVPEPIFHAIIDDYLSSVYVLIPLVHVPTFTAKIASRDYEHEPPFLHLCFAVCAVTVSSIPRNFACHGITHYKDSVEMVDRASHLVLLGRITSNPEWLTRPSPHSIVISIFLSIANHYVCSTNRAWTISCEASHLFRAMELYKKETYKELSLVDGEICKRCFWFLIMINIHDRISFVTPHTGLSYDPQDTSWEFLLPLEQNDAQLVDPTAPADDPPIISGFIAVVRVFLCLIDLLDKAFPGAPAYFALEASQLTNRLFSEQQNIIFDSSPDIPALAPLARVMSRLDTTLSRMPDILKMPSAQKADSQQTLTPERKCQFDIVRTNIHVTWVYLQSMILEMCLNRLEGTGTSREAHSAEQAAREELIHDQLWQMKESLAKELLDIINVSSRTVLEANGYPMVSFSTISKIREVASTFMGQHTGESDGEPSEVKKRHQEYLARFAEILATIDYSGSFPPPQTGSPGSLITSGTWGDDSKVTPPDT